MSHDVLLQATRDQLRAIAALGLDSSTCEITADGRPFPVAGEEFVAVWPGYWRDSASNGETLDEEYGVNITVSLRLPKVPLDRVGTDLLTTINKSLMRWVQNIRAIIHCDPCTVGVGSLSTNVTFAADVPAVLTSEHYSLVFNGTDAHVAVSSRGFPATPFTVAAWVKRNGNQIANARIVDADQAGRGFFLGISVTNTLVGYVGSETGNSGVLDTGTLLADGVWTHVALTYDRANVKLYVGGTLVKTTAYLAGMTVPATMDFGSAAGVAPLFKGRMTNVRLYVGALSASDMATVAAGGESIYSPQAYWEFGEGSGSVVNSTGLSGVRVRANMLLGQASNNDLSGVLNGFITPLAFMDAGSAEIKSASWFSAQKDETSGLAQTIRFGKANRVQSIELQLMDIAG